ncbi:unnamed protein product, partial [Durusdinium trenchii]
KNLACCPDGLMVETDLKRRQGERFQGYLLRVRSEFAKFREWKEEQLRKGRPHIAWEPEADEETPSHSVPAVFEGQEIQSTSKTQETICPEFSENDVPEACCKEDFEELHRKAIKEIEEKIRLFFEPEAEMPRRCPRTADRAVPKLRSPWNPKTVDRQLRHLRRAYSASLMTLPAAASAAAKGEFYNTEEQPVPRGSFDSTSSPAMLLLQRMGLEQRLASGSRARSGNSRGVVKGWLRQLTEDYPEEFCKL